MFCEFSRLHPEAITSLLFLWKSGLCGFNLTGGTLPNLTRQAWREGSGVSLNSPLQEVAWNNGIRLRSSPTGDTPRQPQKKRFAVAALRFWQSLHRMDYKRHCLVLRLFEKSQQSENETTVFETSNFIVVKSRDSWCMSDPPLVGRKVGR